jgi:hypothetical protein
MLIYLIGKKRELKLKLKLERTIKVGVPARMTTIEYPADAAICLTIM